MDHITNENINDRNKFKQTMRATHNYKKKKKKNISTAMDATSLKSHFSRPISYVIYKL